jgi:hypothetical protein
MVELHYMQIRYRAKQLQLLPAEESCTPEEQRLELKVDDLHVLARGTPEELRSMLRGESQRRQ